MNDSFDDQLHVEVVSNTAMRNFIVECKPESVRGKPESGSDIAISQWLVRKCFWGGLFFGS